MKPEWGKITAAEILPPIGGKLVSGKADIYLSGISTDSRNVKNDQIFWALKGDHYDGHDFVMDALEKGASGLVVSRAGREHLESSQRWSPLKSRATIIEVDDTLQSLGDLAGWWRRQYDTQVLGITGSVGKTTTKEMTALILEQGEFILKSRGNFNNLIGLPLTLLQLEPGVTKAVVELGMNVPGEIARLTEISNPEMGLITNVEKVHLEGLGTIDAIAKEKWELVENMPPGGKVIINGDDRLLKEAAATLSRKSMTFGLGSGNDVRGGKVRHLSSGGISFMLQYLGDAWPVQLTVPGLHNVMNALAAAAAGFAFGSSSNHVVKGLERFESVKGRFVKISMPGGIDLVDDSYNANPASLKAVFNVLERMVHKGRRLIVALGDMKELGAESSVEHKIAGSRAVEAGAAYFVALGDYAPEMLMGAVEAGLQAKRAFRADSRDEMVEQLSHIAREGDLVFIKGSRAMGLEKVVEKLRQDVWVE